MIEETTIQIIFFIWKFGLILVVGFVPPIILLVLVVESIFDWDGSVVKRWITRDD